MEACFEGGCLCRSVRYRLRGRPRPGSDCHCEDCRRASGAAYVTWCAVPRHEIEVLSGVVHQIPHAGRLRAFASCCGTPLFIQDDADSPWMDVTVASLDQPEGLRPKAAIWTVDKLPWVTLDPMLRAYSGNKEEGTPS